MRRWLFFLLLLAQSLLGAERALPARPASRISDQSEIFDLLSKRNFAKSLAEEYAQSQISVYVATMKGLSNSEAVAFANRLRNAWITDEMGTVILYGEDTDKVYISLSKAAFKKASATGQLERLASDIDVFNEKGPELGLPKAASSLLDLLRVKPVVAAPAPTPETFRMSVMETSVFLVIGLVLIFLAILGLVRFIRYCRAHNVFTPSNVIKSGRVTPVLGSAIGGVNTAEGKY